MVAAHRGALASTTEPACKAGVHRAQPLQVRECAHNNGSQQLHHKPCTVRAAPATTLLGAQLGHAALGDGKQNLLDRSARICGARTARGARRTPTGTRSF